MRNTVYALTVCLCLALFLSACARRAPQASPVPQDAGIVVAAFNQPVLTSQLLTGQLPERQGRIAPNLLRVLDGDFAQVLHARQRLYTALPPEALPADSVHESATSQGLQHWLRVGAPTRPGSCWFRKSLIGTSAKARAPALPVGRMCAWSCSCSMCRRGGCCVAPFSTSSRWGWPMT